MPQPSLSREASGKFLVSAPEHTAPRRARAYLVTDTDVARTVAYFAPSRPRLDDISRQALYPDAPAEPAAWHDPGNTQIHPDEPADVRDSDDSTTTRDALWLAPVLAPDEGADIAQLMRASGMPRPTLYRHLAPLGRDGHVIQVSRGRWRAATTEDGL
jgi:hypothetical protein